MKKEQYIFNDALEKNIEPAVIYQRIIDVIVISCPKEDVAYRAGHCLAGRNVTLERHGDRAFFAFHAEYFTIGTSMLLQILRGFFQLVYEDLIIGETAAILNHVDHDIHTLHGGSLPIHLSQLSTWINMQLTFSVSKIEIAYDFSAKPYIDVDPAYFHVRSENRTVYSPDGGKKFGKRDGVSRVADSRPSAICMYDRGAKINDLREIYRIEFKLTRNRVRDIILDDLRYPMHVLLNTFHGQVKRIAKKYFQPDHITFSDEGNLYDLNADFLNLLQEIGFPLEQTQNDFL